MGEGRGESCHCHLRLWICVDAFTAFRCFKCWTKSFLYFKCFKYIPCGPAPVVAVGQGFFMSHLVVTALLCSKVLWEDSSNATCLGLTEWGWVGITLLKSGHLVSICFPLYSSSNKNSEVIKNSQTPSQTVFPFGKKGNSCKLFQVTVCYHFCYTLLTVANKSIFCSRKIYPTLKCEACHMEFEILVYWLH